jgi:hypothetical protein
VPAWLILAVLASSCAHTKLKFESLPTEERSGLAISLVPIALHNIKDHDALKIDGEGWTWALTSGPAFVVSVTNRTDQSIDFAGMVVTLRDNRRKTYNVLSKAAMRESNAQLVRNSNKREGSVSRVVKLSLTVNTEGDEAGQDRLLELIGKKIDALRVFDERTEVRPGDTVTSYLVFDLPQHIRSDWNANAEWVFDRQPLIINITNVAVGPSSPRASFEFRVYASGTE